MKNRYLFYMIFLLYICSCNSQKEGEIIIKEINANSEKYPIKFFYYNNFEKTNENLIRLFIPKEIQVINKFDTKINLSNSYLSIKGGNVDSGIIFIMIDNKLENKFSDIDFKTNEKKKFIAYSSYKLSLTNDEFDKIKKESTIAQYLFKSKKEVYDVGIQNDNTQFLKNKIADSLKGFIYLKFYNPTTKKFFGENIKIKF